MELNEELLVIHTNVSKSKRRFSIHLISRVLLPFFHLLGSA